VLARANARLADVRIWLDAPDAVRKRRALERDGETYAPHWDEWQRQWESFIQRESPESWADLRLDGS